MLKQIINRRNRSSLDPSNKPQGTFAVTTNTVASNKWAVAFNVPVVVKGLPVDWKVNGVSPTAVTIVDSQHITLTFAVNVAAGQTYVIPPGACTCARRTEGSSLRRRGRFEALPVAGPHVVSVERSGEAECVWTFSDAITNIESVIGLRTDEGGDGLNFTFIDELHLAIAYGADVSVGSAWETSLAEIVMEFASGQPLQHGSGLITG